MKRVSAGVLKNGFRFYTQLDSRVHVSGVGVRAGSMHDPPGLRGTCHLTEHIVGYYGKKCELKFEEYQCGPEEYIDIRVDHSSTFYGHDLLLKREFMFELFDIMASGLKNPVVSQEALEVERAAVLNEYYLRGIDSMESHIHDLMHQAAYERNPARNRIDCEPNELLKIGVGDLRKFVQSYYVPNNMFAVVLGPSFSKVRNMAEQYFGDMIPIGIPRFPHDLSEKRPILAQVKMLEVEQRGIHQCHVAVGFPTEPYSSKDDEALNVLSEIWRWRLREALRGGNRELGKGVYRALTHISRSFAHGLIYATFATPSEDFARYGIEKVIAECDSLKTKRVLTDEFTAMFNKVHNDYVEDFTNAPGQLTERIIDASCNGDPEMRQLNSYLGRLSRVGKKSLLRVANKYFTTPNYVAVLIKPSAG